ncbi:MAG: hypothetical protein KAR38_06610 [Calditrichia bacterium]|nr:hypothetical protein [Calditrichia bacterium]
MKNKINPGNKLRQKNIGEKIDGNIIFLKALVGCENIKRKTIKKTGIENPIKNAERIRLINLI